MILSVVIVSYNVKYFLEQCLSSLKKAIEGISVPEAVTEVFIIDNASSDGSPDFLEPLFPGFHFIRNTANEGFAKANNRVLPLCHGELILFLNPDTILAEDSLDICISFFRSHPDAGAIGVRMIDGAGRFLRESKRGFPYPAASFFKMSGLAHVFPRSRTFSSYYLGHLSEDDIQSVDILSGAFMMIKKTVLDQTGGFDDQFFMYAEDIDLSYRICKAGFKNYYLPSTTIIHFKGESTQKDIRYIKMFYSAMQLFMKKHFNHSPFSPRLYILNLGLYFREAFAFTRLPFKKRAAGSKTNTSVFIKGNDRDMEKIKQKMASCQMPVSDIVKKGDAVIYLETDTLSWKTIIAEIKKERGEHEYFFHGKGTHALVSSYYGERQGQVIEL